MKTQHLLALALALLAGCVAPHKHMHRLPPSPPGMHPHYSPGPGSVIPPSSNAIPSTMTAMFEVVNSDFGKYQFTATEFQPSNHILVFAKSAGPASEYWDPLVTWGPSPTDQTCGISFYTYTERNFVRAIVTPVAPPTRAPGAPIASITSILADNVKAWRVPATNRTAKRFVVRAPRTQPPITTATQFVSLCPYCGATVISRSCSMTGAASSAGGVMQTWAIAYKCRKCKMTFNDSRSQVMQDVNSIRLPIR